MSKIVTFGVKKGGAWKTSTLLNVACVAANRGKKVCVIDADDNHHCNLFLGLRNKNNEVNPGNNISFIKSECKKPDDLLSHDIKALRDDGYDYIFVDTGGYQNVAFKSAVKSSDIIYLPFQPSLFDIKELVPTLKVILETESNIGIALDNPSFRLNPVLLLTGASYNDRFATNKAKQKIKENNLTKYASFSSAAIPNVPKWKSEYMDEGLSLDDVKHSKRGAFHLLLEEIDNERKYQVARDI